MCVVVITDTRIVIRCAHFQGNFSNKRETKHIFTDTGEGEGRGGGCVQFVAMTTLKRADLLHYLLIKRLALPKE